MATNAKFWDGFESQLENHVENVVEYKIFCLPSISEEYNECTSIEDTLYEILSYAQSLIGDYIWQNECFNLARAELIEELIEKPKEVGVRHGESIQFLKGSTNFGENIDDEWFIVSLLFDITRQFPNVVATVNDNDGEFLLIEAAEYLPKWLEPETSENRVFIYRGKLHIIPLPGKPAEITSFPAGKLTVCQALKILKSNSEKTAALPWIQDPIMEKIKGYPEKAKDCFHNVLCYVPAQVKYLLEKKNSLIAPAVLSFVYRNPVEMNIFQQLTHFSFESLLPCRVRFTKYLYGQLVQQNFIADKSTMKFLPDVSSPAYKGHLIGLQLTYGFEIMYSQQDGYTNGNAKLNTPSGPKWEKYINSLIKHGYFQNEVSGSQLYSQLLENAKEYFTRMCLLSKQCQNSSNGIKKLLDDMPEAIKASAEFNRMVYPPDDDESWLEVSPDELDSILSKYGQSGVSSGEDLDLREVVRGMNSFVESTSSYEGVELPSELHDEDAPILFDPEGFMKSLDKFFTKPSSTSDDDISSDEDLYSGGVSQDEHIKEYASAMDEELSATNIGKSFVKVEQKEDNSRKCSKDETAAQTQSTEGEESTMKPVDIDLNLVQNFLESYSLQEGLPGPVSNILGSIGITLPENLQEPDD